VGRRDARFDTALGKAAPFARPILTRLRAAVHAGCPGVVETMKWSHPSFEHHGLLCGMAAFKAHCSFGFWKHALLVERAGSTGAAQLERLGRLTDVSELPSQAVLVRLVKLAAQLNEQGVEQAKAPRGAPKPPARVPADLARALGARPRARAAFEAFSPSHQCEYIEWLTEAKQPATRERRLATALEWIAEGKPRNWKYQRRA
jgi:uncharacterized protein YdeI (YjbR/CyaY-like superfamily)